MMKLMIVGRRRGGMTANQLHRYMTDVHGATVVRMIGEQPDLTPRRYVQNHVFDDTFRAGAGAADPFALGRDFVTQVWFDHPAQAKASLEAPFYVRDLKPDEDRFVDQASVVKLPVTEESLHGDVQAHGRSKLFVFHRSAQGVANDALAQATRAQWAALLAAPGHGVERVVRNKALSRPDAPASVDFADEAWLTSDAAAVALGEQWQALLDAPALTGMQEPRSAFMLLARERVLFAGAAR